MKTDRTQTLNITEAAEMLGISRGLAYQMVREGDFPVPVLHLGNRLLVSRIRLIEYIEKGA